MDFKNATCDHMHKFKMQRIVLHIFNEKDYTLFKNLSILPRASGNAYTKQAFRASGNAFYVGNTKQEI